MKNKNPYVLLLRYEAQGFIEYHSEESPWGDDLGWWGVTQAGVNAGIELKKLSLSWQLPEAPPWIVEICQRGDILWRYNPEYPWAPCPESRL